MPVAGPGNYDILSALLRAMSGMPPMDPMTAAGFPAAMQEQQRPPLHMLGTSGFPINELSNYYPEAEYLGKPQRETISFRGPGGMGLEEYRDAVPGLSVVDVDSMTDAYNDWLVRKSALERRFRPRPEDVSEFNLQNIMNELIIQSTFGHQRSM